MEARNALRYFSILRYVLGSLTYLECVVVHYERTIMYARYELRRCCK